MNKCILMGFGGWFSFVCAQGGIRLQVICLTADSYRPPSRCSPFPLRGKTRTSLRASRPNESQEVGFLPVPKLTSFVCAQGGTRTRTAKRPTPLKRVCIPIPPPGLNFIIEKTKKNSSHHKHKNHRGDGFCISIYS